MLTRYTEYVKTHRLKKLHEFSSLMVLCVMALSLSACAHFWTTEADKEKAKMYLQAATDQLNERQYTKALESCQKALEADPGLAPVHNHMALIYMETKRYQKSAEAFKKALEIQPHYPEVFNNYGVLLNREEKYAEAIPWFERALKDERYNTPENALTNMGYAYFKLNRLEKAKALHQRALDVMPLFCLANKNLGDIYSKEKNYKKATDAFERAANNCPLYQEAQYKLGLALMKTGSRAVAKAHLEKLVRQHKNGPYVERSQEVLKFLQ